MRNGCEKRNSNACVVLVVSSDAFALDARTRGARRRRTVLEECGMGDGRVSDSKRTAEVSRDAMAEQLA